MVLLPHDPFAPYWLRIQAHEVRSYRYNKGVKLFSHSPYSMDKDVWALLVNGDVYDSLHCLPTEGSSWSSSAAQRKRRKLKTEVVID